MSVLISDLKNGDQRAKRRILILPHFQLPILAINLTAILLVSLVIWGGLERAVSELKPVAGLSGMEADFYRDFLAYQTRIFRTYLIGATVIGMGISTLLTLTLSHRLAGPLVRLRGYFRNLSEAKGAVPNLSFRDGDFMGDLPPLINRAIARIFARAGERDAS